MLITTAGRLSSPHFNGLYLISITDVPPIIGNQNPVLTSLALLSVHQNVRVEINTDSSRYQL